MNDKAYECLFREAAKRSNQRDFAIPDWAGCTPRKIGPQEQQKLHELLLKLVGNPPESDRIDRIAQSCVNVHAEVLADVERILGVTPVFTVGEVISDGGNRLFTCSWADIERWIKYSPFEYTRPMAQFHAWLTVPGMQIVDLTLSALLAKTGYQKHFGVIAQPAENVGTFTYRPVAVGNDLPYRLAAVFVPQ